VYALIKDSEFHAKCKTIVNDSLNGRINAVVSDKNLYEFFAIVTDKNRVEKPLLPIKAIEIINLIIDSEIEIIYSSAISMLKTFELAEKYKVKKQNIFDLVIAGIMLSNGIRVIYTFNRKDFDKIGEINVMNF
jgi:predicted nucleic acid-binding protein